MYGDVEQEILYQNCDIYNARGTVLPQGGTKHDV
jgi:hypothetical protein